MNAARKKEEFKSLTTLERFKGVEKTGQVERA